MRSIIYVINVLVFISVSESFVCSSSLQIKGKKVALLVSVEDTDLTDDFDNSATQDGDLYRDNIEETLEEKDFDDIKKISNPTGDEFLKLLTESINNLKKEDLFVFYFYGHGGQTQDISGDEKGDDNEDETLVLKDREVIDDEIYDILNSYNTHSKIIFIIEACNSGSSIKFYEESNPLIHKTLNEEREKPNLDILYIGATTDGDTVPSNAFNDVLLEVFEDDDIDNYYEFTKSLSELMYEYHDITPTIDISWASQPFLQSQPFK